MAGNSGIGERERERVRERERERESVNLGIRKKEKQLGLPSNDAERLRLASVVSCVAGSEILFHVVGLHWPPPVTELSLAHDKNAAVVKNDTLWLAYTTGACAFPSKIYHS